MYNGVCIMVVSIMVEYCSWLSIKRENINNYAFIGCYNTVQHRAGSVELLGEQ